jgi:NADPH:quinone reductase-like Zn-dependent oxidoreductase
MDATFPASVGQFAVQLAHLSGYKVVTVASPRNHAFVKSLGADAVFDVR